MGTHTVTSECDRCGSESFLIEDTQFDSTEEHCLNGECGYYYHTNLPNVEDNEGYDSPEGVREFMNVIGICDDDLQD
jgi:ribosomal protein L37E